MIIFLTEYCYSFNINGAASFSSSHLRYLVKKHPFDKIKVIYFGARTDFWVEQPDFPHENISIINIPVASPKHSSLSIKKVFDVLLSNKTADLTDDLYVLGFSDKKLEEIEKLIVGEKKIRYIWCEHLASIMYLNFISLPQEYKEKIVYSHHDFLFKILARRRRLFKDILRSTLVKKLELSILRDINYFVSGSSSEIAYARKFLPEHSKCQLLPCLYPDVKEKKRILSSSAPVKIYHLGTASATANRLGLVSFLKEVFPKIEHLDFSLEFIGNVREFLTTAFPEYIDHPKIKIHGYVENIDSLLEANMIHIIPYSGYTGTRTRVGSIIRFQPCIVGYLNLSDNYPILKDRENCIMVSEVNEFIDALSMVIQDKSLRMQLSENVLNDFKQYEDHLSSNESIFCN